MSDTHLKQIYKQAHPVIYSALLSVVLEIINNAEGTREQAAKLIFDTCREISHYEGDDIIDFMHEIVAKSSGGPSMEERLISFVQETDEKNLPLKYR
jgi:hypothetical protein